MHRPALSALLVLAIAGSFVPPAAADDDDDRGRGHKKGHKHDDRDKERFRDGNCDVERKWERNGDYTEVRRCRGARGQQPQRYGQPNVIYPPWIVVEQGAGVYNPQYAPQPPVQPPPQAAAVPISQCNSQPVGQVLGGIVGGVLGNQLGKGGNRTLATLGGAVAGALIGGDIGRRIDAADQACVGQVLEFAPAGQRVQWPAAGTQYAVVPGEAVRRSNSYCRPYTVEVQTPQGWTRREETACRRGDGVWVAG